MKDESPHIFRSLERTVGPDGFDTIVGAAVATYGSLRVPNERQAKDFARLVIAVWDKISSDSRRSLAAGLSKSSRVPREIVDRLLAEPVETAAPFLMTSPVLTAADLASLETRDDARLRKILAGRTAGEETVRSDASAAATSKTVPATWLDTSSARLFVGAETQPEGAASPLKAADESRSSPLSPPAETSTPRKSVVATPSMVPDLADGSGRQAIDPAEPRPAAFDPASTVREKLRHMARPGRHRAGDADAEVRPDMRSLVAKAVRQDTDGFYDGLGRALFLTPQVLRQIEDDAGGHRLAAALKTLKAGTADAMTILMMLKPHIGLDVQAFEQMTKYYGILKADEGSAVAAQAAVREARRDHGLQPQHQETDGVRRPQERPSFGRRQRLPSATGKTGRTS